MCVCVRACVRVCVHPPGSLHSGSLSWVSTHDPQSTVVEVLHCYIEVFQHAHLITCNRRGERGRSGERRSGEGEEWGGGGEEGDEWGGGGGVGRGGVERGRGGVG